MNTRNDSKGFEDSENRFAGMVKGVVVCLLMVGAVVVGSGMQRQGAIVAEANAATVAAPAADTAVRADYFPAQFPAPQGAPEPHIEAF